MLNDSQEAVQLFGEVDDQESLLKWIKGNGVRMQYSSIENMYHFPSNDLYFLLKAIKKLRVCESVCPECGRQQNTRCSNLFHHLAAMKPVMSKVSLEKCARALCKATLGDLAEPDDHSELTNGPMWKQYDEEAKAVLETAGVPYVE